MNEQNLYQYQYAGKDHIIDNTHCALFLDMGLGKTVTSLTAIDILMFQELDISTALIVAPKRVTESVWDTECAKWDHLKHFRISKIVGTAKQRKAALNKKADLYLISRDNIVWLCNLFGGSYLPFDMLVIDELSSFKSPKSNRFKALRLVQPCFKRVVGLTGTPAPNGLIDLWSQIYLLDRGERLGKFISHYREDYFKPGKRNGAIIYKYDLQKDSEQKIHDKISDICISMKAEDYIDMPERTDNYIDIIFPPELQKKYDDFEEEQVLSLFAEQEEGKTISAVNAAALSNKLLQFANGAVYDEKKNWHEVHDLKIEALKELIEDANGKPVLVAYTFRHDLERLLVALKKYKPRQLNTDQDIQDWNSGKIQIMIMHPASGGHGLNLQAGGSIIVWFGQTWSSELYKQFNARLYRQGQGLKVIIHHLVAKLTMDCDVIKALARKHSTESGLLDAIKYRIEKYKKIFKNN